MRRNTVAPVRRTTLAPIDSNRPFRPSLLRPPKAHRDSEDVRRTRRAISSSMGPTSRLSSRPSMSYGGPKRLQDPRPLHDKTYMKSQVESLIRFAIDHGYQHSLSPQMLHNPSGRDFQNIFIFLVKMIDPNFELQKRFEDEVIPVVKAQGYPFSISKSALAAVGSPHTWPTLLGMVMWLVGILKYKEAKANRAAKEDTISVDEKRRRLVYRNVVAAYDQFLQGADEYPELDAELLNPLIEEKEKRIEALELQEKEIEELKTRLEALKSQPSPLELAKDHEQSLIENIKKFSILIPSLEEHAETFARKRREQEAIVSQDEGRMAGLMEEHAVLELELKGQRESGIDSEKIGQDMQRLKSIKNKVDGQRAEVESCQRIAEAEESASVSQLENILKEYHALVWRLDKCEEAESSMDPTSIDWTLRLSADIASGNVKNVLNKDIDNDVMPQLLQLKKQLKAVLPKLQGESLKYQEKVEQAEEHFIVLQDDLSVFESRAKHLEDNYKAALETMRDRRAKWSKSVLDRERQMSSILSEKEDELKKVEDEQAWMTNLLQDINKKLEKRRERLQEIGGLQRRRAEKHKERAEKCWNDLNDYLSNMDMQ